MRHKLFESENLCQLRCHFFIFAKVTETAVFLDAVMERFLWKPVWLSGKSRRVADVSQHSFDKVIFSPDTASGSANLSFCRLIPSSAAADQPFSTGDTLFSPADTLYFASYRLLFATDKLLFSAYRAFGGIYCLLLATYKALCAAAAPFCGCFTLLNRTKYAV